MSKRKKIIFALCSIVLGGILFSGCVNYEKMVAEKEIQNETEEQFDMVVMLGDMNKDAKEEKIAIEESTTGNAVLKLYNGLKVEKIFKLEEWYDYLSLRAFVVDVDNDEQNEIVALIKTSYRNANVVKIINKSDTGEYELFDFPEEVTSNESYSGFNVEVTAKEGFVYLIEQGELYVEIDASRLYCLSMKSEEEYKEIEEKWNKIVCSEFHGESLGVEDICVLYNEKGEKILQVREKIVGGDDLLLGYLVTDIKYSTDGKYSVEQINFKERLDIMP